MTGNQRKESIGALRDLMKREIVMLDGGLGTMIMSLGLEESDFHCEGVTRPDVEMRGCNDILPLSCPEAIYGIHKEYLEAGAQIIESDSFSCNMLTLADYGLESQSYAMSYAAANAARRVVDEWMASHRAGWQAV